MAFPPDFIETPPGPDSPRVLDSPYCRIVVRDHPDTIVSFAAINCPAGKFNTSRIFAKVPQNVVFLNCPKNAWFLDGIPGLGSSIEEAAASLKAILDQLGIGHTRMTYWGGSMGGFGAVAFGALANADLVVATGAELAFLVEGGNSELVLKKCQGRRDFPEVPIRSWVRKSQTRYHLYAGEFAYHDLVSAQVIQDLPRVRLTTLRDFGHALPGYLEEVYGLYPFLCAHMEKDQVFPFQQGEEGILVRHSDWWKDLHAVSMNLPIRAESRILHGLRGMANLPPEVAGHCGHALSKGASLRGDHQAAINFAKEALRISGSGRYLSYRLVQAMQSAGTPPMEWLRSARKIEDLSRSSRLDFGDQLVELIAKGIAGTGDNKEAEKFIANQKRLSKNQPNRLAVLNRLFEKQDETTVWKVGFTSHCSAVFCRNVLDRQMVSSVNQRLMVSGTLLAESPDDQITEVFLKSDDGTITQYFMGHPSPGVANLRPELPHASHTRFKIDIQLGQHPNQTVRVGGRTARGELIEWLVLTKQPAPIA